MEIRFPGGKRVEAVHHGFTIATDQPMAAGGDGSAPTPFDLFLVSLGTCAGYYVLAFCRRRDIPTDDIALHLETVRDEGRHRVERIDITVHLPPDFPRRYVDACLKSIDQCAVKRHLHDPPEIVVTKERA